MSSQNMILIKKCKTEKTSKGYRLKNSTHKLIEDMQKILKSDKDTVITKACKLLYGELANKKNETSSETKFNNIIKGTKNEE